MLLLDAIILLCFYSLIRAMRSLTRSWRRPTASVAFLFAHSRDAVADPMYERSA